jgi:hypothetical protein
MPNQITDWREHVVTTLAAAFPSAEVKSGRRSGVSRDKDRIAVFFEGWDVDAARVVVAKPVLVVRYWKDNSKQPPTSTSWTGHDASELEQASIDLLDALRPIQGLTGIAGRRPWFFVIRTVRVDEDPEEWGVEARLEGFTANEGTIA